MITAGLYRISQIVAVWRNDQTDRLQVLPPCGICRDFMRSLDEGNLEARIVLGPLKSATLRELLPLSEGHLGRCAWCNLLSELASNRWSPLPYAIPQDAASTRT